MMKTEYLYGIAAFGAFCIFFKTHLIYWMGIYSPIFYRLPCSVRVALLLVNDGLNITNIKTYRATLCPINKLYLVCNSPVFGSWSEDHIKAGICKVDENQNDQVVYPNVFSEQESRLIHHIMRRGYRKKTDKHHKQALKEAKEQRIRSRKQLEQDVDFLDQNK